MIIKRYTHLFHFFFFIYLYSIIFEIDKVSFFQNLSLQNARTPHSSSYKSSFWGTFSSMSNFYELNFYYIFLLYLFIFFTKSLVYLLYIFPHCLFSFFFFIFFIQERSMVERGLKKVERISTTFYVSLVFHFYTIDHR